VGVQIEHEGPAMEPFRLNGRLRHGGHASKTTVRSLTVAADASPPSGSSARSA
jgi:hypothetical protein